MGWGRVDLVTHISAKRSQFRSQYTLNIAFFIFFFLNIMEGTLQRSDPPPPPKQCVPKVACAKII